MSALPDDPPPFPPFRVRRSERIYDSSWCGLRRDQVILPGGDLAENHVFEVPDAAACVPSLADGRLVLIGQYRYPHGKTHWEVPAGRIGEGETPAAAAARETLEETGYRPTRLLPLGGFYPTNGISAHYAHLFCGLECELVGEPALDPSEQILTRLFTRGEVEALLDAGRLQDGFTALAVLYWLRLTAHKEA